MNSRLATLLAAILAGGFASAAPIKYTVFVKSEKVGSLVQETSGDDDSGYIDDSTMTMNQEGKTATMHEIVHYGKDGVVTSRTMDVSGGDQDLKIKAALSDTGAKLSFWMGEDKDEKDITLATKTTRADPSNFWFKKVTPDPGTSITYQSFDLQEAKWSDVTLKFVGKVKVKIGDQELEENEIDRKEGEDETKIYVDTKGDAVLIIDGEMRIERQNISSS